ncbi:MAG TPA: hypothetical protein VGR97_12310 [Candidatus Acidoferrales bacterium]|nr:hypothetical protein [Candidatus Acidoferrales bacterium]
MRFSASRRWYPKRRRAGIFQRPRQCLDQPKLRAQRLLDDANDSKPHIYYRWIQNAVDFITLDNGIDQSFDAEQLAWFEARLRADSADSGSIRSSWPCMFLTGTVNPDGQIKFKFHELEESDVPGDVVQRYTPDFVHWCFTENSDAKPRRFNPY